MDSASTVMQGFEALEQWQTELYQDLHRHPELSMQETRTADVIARELEGIGYEVQRIGGGVVGVLANGDGSVVASRADFDGLPVAEETGLDYASTDTATDESGRSTPVMHACGHDLHVAALLAAGRLLAESKDAWKGTHVALFQPGEETAAGAQAMVDDGLADKVPAPSVVLGQHVMPSQAGRLGTTAGPILSAGDSIEITLHGAGAHGSMPHLSVDPVVLASSIVLRLQSIVSREVTPGQFAVVTVGSITAGAKSNIIPQTATLLLNVRTYDEDVRRTVLQAIERIVRGECQAAGTPREPEFRYYDQFPLTDNDAEPTETVTAAFQEHFGQDAVSQQSPLTASEDFSRLPNAFGAPYTYWTVGGIGAERWERSQSSDKPEDKVAPNHSPRFYPDLDPTLRVATEAQVVAFLAQQG